MCRRPDQRAVWTGCPAGSCSRGLLRKMEVPAGGRRKKTLSLLRFGWIVLSVVFTGKRWEHATPLSTDPGRSGVYQDTKKVSSMLTSLFSTLKSHSEDHEDRPMNGYFTSPWMTKMSQFKEMTIRDVSNFQAIIIVSKNIPVNSVIMTSPNFLKYYY